MTARSELERLFHEEAERHAGSAAGSSGRPTWTRVGVLPEKPADCSMSDEEWMILTALGITTRPPDLD